MSEIVPICHIKDNKGIRVINLVDFDDKVHTRATQDEIEKSAAKAVAENAAPAKEVEETGELKAVSIGNNGLKGDKRKFILLDQNSAPFGTDEYDDEAAAFAALTATVKTE